MVDSSRLFPARTLRATYRTAYLIVFASLALVLSNDLAAQAQMTRRRGTAGREARARIRQPARGRGVNFPTPSRDRRRCLGERCSACT